MFHLSLKRFRDANLYFIINLVLS